MSKSTTFAPDPLRDPIYIAVGRAIEEWSWVETNLAILLEGLMWHGRSDLVGPAFHAVVNFNSKLKMVDTVAQRVLTAKRLDGWNTLRNRISKKADKRNEIAHSAIVMHGRTAPLVARLHPYWAITKDIPAKKGDGLSVQQLNERAASFTDVSIEILDFYRRLPKRLRPRAKSRPSRA